MEKIKVIVVGCGSIGLRHLQNLLVRDDVILAALDMNEERKSDVNEISSDIAFFTNENDAAAWNAGLAIVATPNHLHLSGSLWAFSNGAHVLCEKPLADTVENAEKIITAAKEAGKLLAVGYTERYRAAIQYIKKAIADGELGNLIGGRAMVGTYNTLLCAKDPQVRATTLGIILVDYTHELDILADIFGSVKNLECYANTVGDKERKANPSLVALLLKYDNDAVVSVHFDYVQHPQRRIIEFYGDRKTLVYDFGADSLEIYDCTKSDVENKTFDNDRDAQFKAEHEDILSAIHKNTDPGITGESALRSLVVAERAVNILKANL